MRKGEKGIMNMYPFSAVLIAGLACCVISAIAMFLICKHEYLSTIHRLVLAGKKDARKWKSQVNAAYQAGLQEGLSKGAIERNKMAEEMKDLRSQIRMEAWLDKRIASKGKVIECPFTQKPTNAS